MIKEKIANTSKAKEAQNVSVNFILPIYKYLMNSFQVAVECTLMELKKCLCHFIIKLNKRVAS